MFALMFALARMASAAWVGAAVLFVIVSVSQIRHFDPQRAEPAAAAPEESNAGEKLPPHLQLDTLQRKHVIAQLALLRFPFYYETGAVLLGVSLFSAAFLRRTYLKASRWTFVMVFLMGACGFLAYDWQNVYQPLRHITQKIANDPAAEVDPLFQTLHEHSKQVNGAQLVLTFLASLLMCLPGTRPEPSIVFVKEQK